MMNQEIQKSWEQQLLLIKQLTDASIVFFVQLHNSLATIIISTDAKHSIYTAGSSISMSHAVIKNVTHKKSTVVLDMKTHSPTNQGENEYISAIGHPVYVKQDEIWGIIVVLNKKDVPFTKKHISIVSTFEKTISDQIKLSQIESFEQQRNNNSQNISSSGINDLLKTIPGIPWILDLNTHKYIYLGEQSKTITGFTPTDWLTLKEWSNAIHQDDREWVLNYYLNIKQQTNLKNHEYRLIKKDGSIIWVKDVLKLRYTKNNPSELSGLTIEINDIKKKEERITLLNNQLNFILKSTNTVLTIVDGQGKIIFHSQEDSGKIPGTCYEHFRKRKEKCDQCPRKKPIPSKATFHYKLPENGKTIQLTAFPFKGENNEIFMAEVRVDITERVQAEKEIAELKDQLEFSMDVGNIAFVKYNLKEETIHTNTFFEKVTGYKFNSKKIKLAWILSRIHPQDIKYIHAHFAKKHSKPKKKLNFEFRFLDAYNKYLWIKFAGKVIEFNQDLDPVIITGIINEITAYKSLLDDLTVERNKSLSATKTKSLFLANMSHEIRTPMNAIIGFSELLGKHIEKPPFNGYLNSIKSSGKILLSLINDLLDLEKIEAGKMLLSKEYADFSSIIQEIEQTFLMISREKNISIVIKKPDSFPTSINIDTLKIRQVLLNLVNNALKFTREGIVTIQYSFRQYPESKKGSLTLSVIDTGIGISKEKQTAIFKPFIQDANPNKKDHQGTGLGLSIVQKLVNMMGGTISLISQVNCGSNFSILIPNVETSTENYMDINDEDYNQHRYNKELVLLVDDIESNLDILKAYCTNLNLTYVFANNGQEAIEIAKAHKPKIIIMDLRMPVLDGYQTIEIIRKNEELKQIPVIAISASSKKNERESIYKAGFNSFLEKPIMEANLNKEISKYMNTIINDNDTPLVKKVKRSTVFSATEKLALNISFDQKVIPIWEGLKHILSSKQLNRFAESLSEITQQVNWIELEEYNKQLKIAIQSFDYESIQKLVNNFNYYLNQLK